ncbi:MAG: hypothetical protein FWC72_07185, partial [Oscillospiraceae bacterium]|nr:hypothetical protein [Oscillospiraceae bacterium]
MQRVDRRALVAICVLILAILFLMWVVGSLLLSFELPNFDGNFGGISDVISGAVDWVFDLFGGERAVNTYIYPSGDLILVIDGFIDAAHVHGDWIYFCFAHIGQSHSAIQVERVTADGTVGQSIRIPWASDSWPLVVGFDMPDLVFLRFLIWDMPLESGSGTESLIYAIYNREG